jgi:hypothetical protein
MLWRCAEAVSVCPSQRAERNGGVEWGTGFREGDGVKIIPAMLA